MQIHVTESDGTPYYLQMVSQIKLQVASGRLEPGEQLPPVRKLAEQLLVNPNTVARAYRELEQEGIVTTRRGAGVFVAESGTSPFARREKLRMLNDRIDALLTEATHLGIDIETVHKLIDQRRSRFESGEQS